MFEHSDLAEQAAQNVTRNRGITYQRRDGGGYEWYPDPTRGDNSWQVLDPVRLQIEHEIEYNRLSREREGQQWATSEAEQRWGMSRRTEGWGTTWRGAAGEAGGGRFIARERAARYERLWGRMATEWQSAGVVPSMSAPMLDDGGTVEAAPGAPVAAAAGEGSAGSAAYGRRRRWNRWQYFEAGDGYEGDRFNRHRTPGGATRYYPEGEEPPTEEGGEGGGGGRTGRPWRQRVFGDIMQGAALGGIGAALAGGAFRSAVNPMEVLLSEALRGLGGTGSGLLRIGHSIIESVATGIQMAAQAGATIIGGAFSLVLGPALAGLTGMFAGVLGTMFAQAGRALGDTIGGIAQVFADTTREGTTYADTIARISTLSGLSVQSTINWTTGLRALGLSMGQSQQLLEGFGQRIEFTQARLSAFGISIQQGASGEVDSIRTLMAVRDRLAQYPDIMQRPLIRSVLGPGAEALLPAMRTPGLMERAAATEARTAPMAAEVQQIREQLTGPMAEMSLLWERLKVGFVADFAPLMAQGINGLTALWGQHKEKVLEFFHELPGRALNALARLVAWGEDMYEKWAPPIRKFWDEFRQGADTAWNAAGRLLNWIDGHPVLAAIIGGGVLGGRGGAIGAGLGAAIGGAAGHPWEGAALGLGANRALGNPLGGIGWAAAAAGIGGLSRVIQGIPGAARAAWTGLTGLAGALRSLPSTIGGALAGLRASSLGAGLGGAAGFGIGALAGSWGDQHHVGTLGQVGLGFGAAAAGAGAGFLMGGPVGAILGGLGGLAGGLWGGSSSFQRDMHGRAAMSAEVDAHQARLRGMTSAQRRRATGADGGRLSDRISQLANTMQSTLGQPLKFEPLEIKHTSTVKVDPTDRFWQELENREIEKSWHSMQVALA